MDANFTPKSMTIAKVMPPHTQLFWWEPNTARNFPHLMWGRSKPEPQEDSTCPLWNLTSLTENSSLFIWKKTPCCSLNNPLWVCLCPVRTLLFNAPSPKKLCKGFHVGILSCKETKYSSPATGGLWFLRTILKAHWDKKEKVWGLAKDRLNCFWGHLSGFAKIC